MHDDDGVLQNCGLLHIQIIVLNNDFFFFSTQSVGIIFGFFIWHEFIAEIGLNKRKLSDYVHHYEELKYDTDDIHAQHHRHKRSAPEDEDRVRVYFHSHGRPFDLELERDHSVFHNNLIVERNNEAFKPDLSHIYHGKLIGEPNSHCFGAIRDGVFDGQIHTATDGIYYVERANR